MNKIPILLIILLFLGCKKDKKDPEPSPIIKEIVGKWRLVATERTENGKIVREEATSESSLIFRFDGLMVDKDGLPVCCAFGSFIVNGQPFEAKALAPVPQNEACARTSCTNCSAPLALLQDGNTLITSSSCFGEYRFFYVRN